MPGTSSEQQPRRRQVRQAGLTPSLGVPEKIRITCIYATPWHLPDGAAGGDLGRHLKLWRFEHYYRLSADQLPAVIHREALDPATLRLQRWQHAGQLTGAQIWLFRLPSGQVTVALSLDMQLELINTIDLLEDCYFADVRIGEATIEAYVRTMATQFGALASDRQDFLPERHQLVLAGSPAPSAGDGEDLIQRLIYRADLPCRKEHSAIRYPAELNRRPGGWRPLARTSA